MSLNKILLATLVGGVVFFLLGWLVWGILLAKFMEANQGTATGVMKAESEMIWWALILSQFIGAFLLAYIFGKWANISTFVTGAKAGALIMGLIAASLDLMWYASSNVMTLNGAMVDILASAVVGAIVGGVIGLVLGSGKKS